MNIAIHRLTISTLAVAVCAMLALVAAEPVQAREQGASAPALSAPLQRIEIVGRRASEPGVQRIVIVGQRQRAERVAAAEAAAQPL